jgi:hypothetical protein
MLTSYFDESGTHGGARNTIVAEYVSTVERWAAFEGEWREFLQDCDLEYFHMVDFAARREQYRNWKEPKRTERLARAIDIINRHVMFSVLVNTDPEAFERLMSPAAKAAVGGPYGLCAIAAMRTVGFWTDDQKIDEPIPHVFEVGAEGASEVVKAFQMAYADARLRKENRMIGLVFRGKREVVQLQAADILAWECHRYLTDWGFQGAPPKRRRSYDRLITEVQNRWLQLHAEVYLTNASVAFDMHGLWVFS